MNNCTIPWSQDELLQVNDISLCYSFKEGELIVRFPGGAASPLHEVQAWARRIVLPQRLRQPALYG